MYARISAFVVALALTATGLAWAQAGTGRVTGAVVDLLGPRPGRDRDADVEHRCPPHHRHRPWGGCSSRCSSGVRGDQFDAASQARRTRQWRIACQDHRLERFGERHVHRVVRAEILAQRPDSIEERFVRMALEVQRVQILESRDCRGRLKGTGSGISSQRLRDLDVREVRDMETNGRIANPRRDDVPDGRMQQQFDERGCVKDDHRASRSARITSAGRGLRCRTGRARRRSRIS